MQIRDILKHPSVYLLFQGMVGAKRARRLCIEQWVRPTPGLRVLDIGCGPGYVVEYFKDPEYVGFDIEPSYIEYAKRRYGSKHEFYCQWFDEETRRKFEPFDVVLMTGVIHHLSDDDAARMLTLAKTCLKANGHFVALESCYQDGQSAIAKFLLANDRGEYIRTQPSYEKLALSVFGRVRSTVRHDLMYFPYTLALLDCQP
jgi:SAM-dependent methyltransferase